MSEQDKQKTTGAWRRNDPTTSEDAAKSVDASRLGTIVYTSVVVHKKGQQSEEISDYTGIPLQSVTPRLRPLERKGLIYRTTERRRGKSGRLRIVWMAEVNRPK